MSTFPEDQPVSFVEFDPNRPVESICQGLQTMSELGACGIRSIASEVEAHRAFACVLPSNNDRIWNNLRSGDVPISIEDAEATLSGLRHVITVMTNLFQPADCSIHTELRRRRPSDQGLHTDLSLDTIRQIKSGVRLNIQVAGPPAVFEWQVECGLGEQRHHFPMGVGDAVLIAEGPTSPLRSQRGGVIAEVPHPSHGAWQPDKADRHLVVVDYLSEGVLDLDRSEEVVLTSA